MINTVDDNSNENEFNNWLNFEYNYSSFSTGFRFEAHDPENENVYSNDFSQRFLEYRNDWLKLRVGNFYERFGRGIIFHTFEIQSQTLDRTEQNFIIDRNIDGVNLHIATDNLEVKGIFGKPLKMLSSERGRSLGGGEIQYRPAYWLLLGGTYLNSSTDDFLGGTIDFDISSAELGLNIGLFDIYTEIAHSKSSQPDLQSDGDALYVNATYSGEYFGLSADMKRYENFSTIFNNPPALVKTHSFTLLNRHTHSLNAKDETGFQFEGYMSPTDKSTFTIHASGSDNIERNDRRRFREYFIQNRQEWGDNWISRVLVDYSKDRPVGDLNRWTLATEVDYFFQGLNSIVTDFQVQSIDNENSGKHWNYLGVFAFSRAPRFTATLQSEWTTDETSLRSNWTAGILSLKIMQQNDLLLTLGARPPGIVCSGGICTFVPEFEGFEARWNFRIY